MDLKEAIEQRHSVRAYLDKPIEGEVLEQLLALISECNKEGKLHIQLILNEPQAFSSLLAKYGRFSGVKNYIALIGPEGPDLEEKCGYYGEKIVLGAQMLGLNTCWVAMTYKKVPGVYRFESGDKLVMVIAVGYGKTQGNAHRSKDVSTFADTEGTPEWFRNGVEAAVLAPTAVNQQKFRFELRGDKVLAQEGRGPHTKTDLGIVKYHFEAGSGKDHTVWL